MLDDRLTKLFNEGMIVLNKHRPNWGFVKDEVKLKTLFANSLPDELGYADISILVNAFVEKYGVKNELQQ